MITELFIYNDAANSVVFSQPELTELQSKILAQAIFTQANPQKLVKEECWSFHFMENQGFLQKFSPDLIVGAIVKNVSNKKRLLDRIFERIFNRVLVGNNPILKTNEFFIWISDLILEFNSSKNEGSIIHKLMNKEPLVRFSYELNDAEQQTDQSLLQDRSQVKSDRTSIKDLEPVLSDQAEVNKGIIHVTDNKNQITTEVLEIEISKGNNPFLSNNGNTDKNFESNSSNKKTDPLVEMKNPVITKMKSAQDNIKSDLFQIEMVENPSFSQKDTTTKMVDGQFDNRISEEIGKSINQEDVSQSKRMHLFEFKKELDFRKAPLKNRDFNLSDLSGDEQKPANGSFQMINQKDSLNKISKSKPVLNLTSSHDDQIDKIAILEEEKNKLEKKFNVKQKKQTKSQPQSLNLIFIFAFCVLLALGGFFILWFPKLTSRMPQ